jgi:hypothetical protein
MGRRLALRDIDQGAPLEAISGAVGDFPIIAHRSQSKVFPETNWPALL